MHHGDGTPAWEADALGEPAEGYIALQAEVPGGGRDRGMNQRELHGWDSRRL
jgi:hypothetical protein